MYTPSILGAFLPSVALLLDSILLYPSMIEVLNLNEDLKKKYYTFLENYNKIAGPMTFIVAILHIPLNSVLIF